jgi:RNA-directed DNA polymerase
MSSEALRAKGDELRAMRIHSRTTSTLGDLARWLNPIVGGWMNYYGRFYRSEMYPLLLRVNSYVKRWAGKKYRRLRTHSSFQRWWAGLIDRHPRLFVQWKWVEGYWPAA